MGCKPTSLGDAEAAALPLTSITAWEMPLLKPKALSLHWEMMFARSRFETPDMARQAELLDEVAALVDAGRIRSTLTEVAGKIDAATLRAAHARVESGSARAKIVLEGF